MIAIIAPKEAGIGLARLFNPLSNAVWPHVHNLAFKSPVTRLALGQPFEVEVIDHHGTPPDDVRIQYRYATATGEMNHDEEKVRSINGTLLARKDQVVRPFEYRAVGGDDRNMDWVSLEVVEPPRLESLEISLHPPTYTGFASQTLGGGARQIEALAGTQVEISGTVTKPLASAVLKQEHGASVPATCQRGWRIVCDSLGFDAAVDRGEIGEVLARIDRSRESDRRRSMTGGKSARLPIRHRP